MVKDNHGEMKAAIALVVEEGAVLRSADVERWEKGHGRIEYRAYWWVEVDDALRTYLADAYGWTEVRWCGLGRRRWRYTYERKWHEEERIFLFSSGRRFFLTPEQLSQWARRHWHIENRAFWVLDVTYQEDRNHARHTGPLLHLLRVAAISIIRRQGCRYVPDGRRIAAARPDRGLEWLLVP